MVKPALLLLCAATVLCALELSTGAMLGTGYDPVAFYVRDGAGPWRKTYSEPAGRPEAQGKLMNLRLAQGLFHDEWMTEKPFDPARNTAALIAALDFYRRHGILMVNVSLQGGNAGYAKEVNGIDRRNGYHYGPSQGMHVSAFRPDGSLKPEWMERLGRLLRAADRRGMIVNVMYFYQGQDELFPSPAEIHAAARNATDWLITGNHRNVLIDVANEFDLRSSGWDHGRYIPDQIGQLMREVRSRFREQKAGWAAPVGASTAGNMTYPEGLRAVADVILIHGNNRTPEEKVKKLEAFRNSDRPVLMNEDDNGRETTPEHLRNELSSCDLLFRHAAGWGYMPWVQAQRFPFRYLPGRGKDRDMAYFHDVLDHVAELVRRARPD